MKRCTIDVSEWFAPPQKDSPEYEALLQLFTSADRKGVIALDEADLAAVVYDPGHSLRCKLYELGGNINAVRACFELCSPQAKDFGALVQITCSQSVDMDMLKPLTDALNEFCAKGEGLLIFGLSYHEELHDDQIRVHILISAPQQKG